MRTWLMIGAVAVFFLVLVADALLSAVYLDEDKDE